MPDDVTAALAEIRGEVADLDKLIKRMRVAAARPAVYPVPDKLAARVPRLLAALDEALAFHQAYDGYCGGCLDAYGQGVKWPCDEYQAISRALLGEESSDGKD
jgi:hypothetical protein